MRLLLSVSLCLIPYLVCVYFMTNPNIKYLSCEIHCLHLFDNVLYIIPAKKRSLNKTALAGWQRKMRRNIRLGAGYVPNLP